MSQVQGVPNLQTYEVVLLAGAQFTLAAQGRFFAILESPQGAVEIKIDGGPTAVLSRGLQYFMEEGRFFEELTILNPAAVATTIKLAVGNGDLRDNRSVESGPVSVTGTLGVIGQPLTDDGGSISNYGASYWGLASDRTGLGALVTNVFTAAANVNGAFIRHVQIIRHLISQGGTTANSSSFREIPALDVILKGTFDPGLVIMPREFYLPAGLGLEYFASAFSVELAFVRYDFL